MKEKIITIVFCLVICGISGTTLFQLMFPQNSANEETGNVVEENMIAEYHEKEKELMQESQKENGNIESDDTEQNSFDKEDITQDDTAQSDAKEEKKGSFLDAISNAVDGFTNNLSGKEEGAKINSKISSVTSGNTYIESKTVLLGKDNWLFYKAADDGDTISDYKGTNHYSKEKMKSIMEKLEKESAALRKNGCRLVLLMIPNKESVYSEYMPENVKRKSDETRMDLFVKYLQKNSKLKVVYPKQELIAAKTAYQTYYKTDTHWNQIGTFIGVQALKEKIDRKYDSLSNVEFKIKKKNYAGDLAKLCKMADTYNDDIKYELKTSSVDRSLKSKKKILIIGDSFSDLMPDIMKEYFADVRTVGVWSFNMEEVEEYKPDIVVWECVERYLDRYDWIKLTE